MSTRKDFLKNAALLGAGTLVIPKSIFAQPAKTNPTREAPSKWSDGSRPRQPM